MEKEMKKLLLVAVSVGVFLLVTITVAIVVLTPKVHVQESAFSSSVPYSHGRTLQTQENIPPTPAIISSPQNDIDMLTAADENNGDSLIIQIPMPTTAAVPDNSDIPAVPVVRQEPAAPAVKPVQSTTAKPAATTTVKPAATARPAAPARPATPTRAINDYWVQTGAFSSMVRAEDAKEMLSARGLTSIIETRIVNGQNFFRVRLGPYTSENEARHWLEIVKLIDGFHESQVRQTVRQN